ncbi:MAG: hypothetical protein Q4D76_20105, partial [Oscillospiraceae bacterium]|nr:hypothetical protein [Oscillospiraceae bacterium]
MRFFMASSRTFKRQRILSLTDEDISKQLYSIISFPQFVWVCELYDLDYYENKKQPIGEIVLDATATATTKSVDSIILVNYPGKYYIHFRSKVPDNLIELIFENVTVEDNTFNNHNSIFIIDEENKIDSFNMFDENLRNLVE